MPTAEADTEILDYVRGLIKFKRHARSLGLRALCRQCGVSISTLSRFEGGGGIDAETFIKLINWLKP
jgi:transcriptional regulator with XRE-family HTH domain